MKYILQILFVLIGSFYSRSQEDTVEIKEQDLQEISIYNTIIRISPFYIFDLDKAKIRDLNAQDAGELMRYVPGLVIKSYGGLGGMKTVSSRGLSSQDNSIVVDGFERNGMQTGQVNLAQIETDQLIAVRRMDPEFHSVYVPVSAMVKGDILELISLLRALPSDTFQLKASARYGSFDTYEGNASILMAGKRSGFSLFGKYRRSEGDYDYTFRNGTIVESGTRANNDYRDLCLNGAFAHRFRKNALNVRYRFMSYDQGLPGSVILYNAFADERLKGNDHRLEADIASGYRSWGEYRFYGAFGYNELTYSDPSFYANDEGLNTVYRNYEAVLGASYLIKKIQSIRLLIGLESKYSYLDSDRYFAATPSRNSTILFLSGGRKIGDINISISTPVQFYSDINGSEQYTRWAFTPALSMYRHESSRGISWKADLKRSFRMPTFNELYYGGIGNIELNPEKADQLNIAISYRNKANRTWSFQSKYMLHSALIRDKINAIPTKNLFVWSMQNVGRVLSYGIDTDLKLTRKIVQNTGEVSFGVVYNWLVCLDITNPESPSYLDQIAYMPEHSISADLGILLRDVRISVMNTILSHRYALNENIDANLVEGFWITDLSLTKRFKIGGNQGLSMQAKVNNVFNQSYAYVRNFVMPSINYQLTIRYEFN